MMKTVAVVNLVIFLVVCGAVVFSGLDLRKWTSWLLGAYGFLSGFLVGLLVAHMEQPVILGALFALAVLFGGGTTRWHRLRYRE
jgi:hypothetical protein